MAQPEGGALIGRRRSASEPSAAAAGRSPVRPRSLRLFFRSTQTHANAPLWPVCLGSHAKTRATMTRRVVDREILFIAAPTVPCHAKKGAKTSRGKSAKRRASERASERERRPSARDPPPAPRQNKKTLAQCAPLSTSYAVAAANTKNSEPPT